MNFPLVSLWFFDWILSSMHPWKSIVISFHAFLVCHKMENLVRNFDRFFCLGLMIFNFHNFNWLMKVTKHLNFISNETNMDWVFFLPFIFFIHLVMKAWPYTYLQNTWFLLFFISFDTWEIFVWLFHGYGKCPTLKNICFISFLSAFGTNIVI